MTSALDATHILVTPTLQGLGGISEFEFVVGGRHPELDISKLV